MCSSIVNTLASTSADLDQGTKSPEASSCCVPVNAPGSHRATTSWLLIPWLLVCVWTLYEWKRLLLSVRFIPLNITFVAFTQWPITCHCNSLFLISIRIIAMPCRTWSERFMSVLSSLVDTSHMWPLSLWSGVSLTEELNFYFYFILLSYIKTSMWLVALYWTALWYNPFYQYDTLYIPLLIQVWVFLAITNNAIINIPIPVFWWT